MGSIDYRPDRPKPTGRATGARTTASIARASPWSATPRRGCGRRKAPRTPGRGSIPPEGASDSTNGRTSGGRSGRQARAQRRSSLPRVGSASICGRRSGLAASTASRRCWWSGGSRRRTLTPRSSGASWPRAHPSATATSSPKSAPGSGPASCWAYRRIGSDQPRAWPRWSRHPVAGDRRADGPLRRAAPRGQPHGSDLPPHHARHAHQSGRGDRRTARDRRAPDVPRGPRSRAERAEWGDALTR